MTARQLLSLFVLVTSLLPTAATADDVIEYYGLDALGNVRLITDENGNVIERHDYYPFGEECTTGSCASNPGVGAGQARKFTGKERDAETGLDYFGARYYGSKIGRFTTVDPVYTWNDNLLDPQRWNRYSYGRNNPLRYADPDGRAIDILVDAGSITYDLSDIYATYKTGNSPTTTQWLALGGDVVGAAVPFVTGIGAVIRAGSKVDDLVDGANAAKKVPNPWGQAGKPDHQATVQRLRDQAQAEFADDIVHEGTSIRSQTGVNRRPDVWVENAQTGQVNKVYEAARTNKSGGFVSRERAKAADYQGSNIPAHFEAVKKEQ